MKHTIFGFLHLIYNPDDFTMFPVSEHVEKYFNNNIIKIFFTFKHNNIKKI